MIIERIRNDVLHLRASGHVVGRIFVTHEQYEELKASNFWADSVLRSVPIYCAKKYAVIVEK